MHLTWGMIVRLGLVQMALGAIVVLTTSTLNRLMVVEMALPAVLPGALVALHYGIQMTRPHWGFASDRGGNRTRWIVGGIATLGAGAFAAAVAVPLFGVSYAGALALSILGYALIGLGAGAAGTSVLALLATATAEHRRAAAATITWLMMIFGIAMTATVTGKMLDPYTPALMLQIVGTVVLSALAITVLAVWGIERRVIAAREPEQASFRDGLAEIWSEPRARAFTVFVFLSMTAYFMQELILEPYAGLIFGLTPGQSTSLSGAQNGGVFLGMLLVGVMATGFRKGVLRSWVIAGCLGSAASLAAVTLLAPLALAALNLTPAVMMLGFFNGMFAVAAIGSMMALAGEGRRGREGTRMGLWGAAQAVAAGFGGLDGCGSGRSVPAGPAGRTSLWRGLSGRGGAVRPVRADGRAHHGSPHGGPHTGSGRMTMEFDAIVVGGGPAGATAAEDLARSGVRVALLDRAGRIKPCGGAIPPRLIADFNIPDSQIVAKITTARMISPTGRKVDIPIEGGFVGMVDREQYDEFLRERAAGAGATRVTGTFVRIAREGGKTHVVYRDKTGAETQMTGRVVIGADGARSDVARAEVPGGDKIPYVIAYHEIVAAPETGPGTMTPPAAT